MVGITVRALSLLLLLVSPSFSTTQSSENEIPLLRDDLEPVYNEEPFTCQDHLYTVHIFSRKPLVIYISSFITPEERAHLISTDESKFTQSSIRKNGIREVDVGFRSSWSAWAPRDEVTSCVETRAKAFQGYGQAGDVEPLQIVQYAVGEQYKHHYDWSIKSSRESTFFAYLDANCTGGGTNFPRLSAPPGEKWCEFIECGESAAAGVTFKPIEGNAIFWQNIDVEHGQKLYPEVLHAGLPVTSGRKVGLNIWTRTVAASLESKSLRSRVVRFFLDWNPTVGLLGWYGCQCLPVVGCHCV